MGYYVGIDLGGTNIAVGVVDENYNIIGKANSKTRAHHPVEEIADDMAAAALEAIKDAGLTLDDIDWIGVGTPGTVNPKTGVVGLAANIGFHDTPIGELIAQRISKPVYVENDANAAAFGELMAGAALGLDSAIMITLGTGVGGGIIIDGKIYSGFNYKGAELGHISMVYQGVPCTCGRRGCIEAYCSVSALIRITRDSMQLNAKSKMWELAEYSLDKVNGRTAFDAMRAGDEAGTQVVDQYIDYIANAVSGMINLFQPQAVVIGGGISKEGESLFEPVRERTYPQTFNHDPSYCTKILQAKLGNDAGIIGAALLGKQYE
ncbi:ROK family protein [Oscillospiraceae bacterium PP1C4]